MIKKRKLLAGAKNMDQTEPLDEMEEVEQFSDIATGVEGDSEARIADSGRARTRDMSLVSIMKSGKNISISDALIL